MKIYISGKIAGDPDYKGKFARAAAQLERLGATVINPATAPERLDNGACNQVCKYNTPDRGCVAGELGARCDLTNVAGKRRCAVAGTYIDKMGCLG